MSERFVLATANPDKAIEIREILTDIELVERPVDVPEVDETGTTLEENARLKAVALVEATGLAAIADDTGLEVDALGGAPGIYAARYAGENVTYEDNRNKLMKELSGVPLDKRSAKFRTVALLRRPDGSELIANGVVEGVIAEHEHGEGWGYDPIFIPNEGEGRRFSEMSGAEKNAISHRGRAFTNLAEMIRAQ